MNYNNHNPQIQFFHKRIFFIECAKRKKKGENRIENILQHTQKKEIRKFRDSKVRKLKYFNHLKTIMIVNINQKWDNN